MNKTPKPLQAIPCTAEVETLVRGTQPETDEGALTPAPEAATWFDQLHDYLGNLPGQGLAEESKGHYRAEVPAALRSGNEPPLRLLTADSILDTDWPEPRWAVPGLLPAGLTILAGKPKVGKSWLSLQIALAVAAGGVTFGERVVSGPVLYLALEDPPRRLKDRMQKQGWPRGLQAEFMPIGEFASQIGDLRNCGAGRLAQQIKLRGYRLVVIDTLSRAVFGDQNDVAQMTPALSQIQEMALGCNCAVLMNDHHHKLGGNDLIRDILGSTAKGAVIDTAWGLYAEPGKAGAKLSIIGRDVAEKSLDLTFDAPTGCWQVQGETGELKMTERRSDILEAVKTLGASQLDAIAEKTGQDRGNEFRRLQDLANGGYVMRQDGDSILYDLTEKGREYLAAQRGGGQ